MPNINQDTELMTAEEAAAVAEENSPFAVEQMAVAYCINKAAQSHEKRCFYQSRMSSEMYDLLISKGYVVEQADKDFKEGSLWLIKW